ncbi:MAG: hypothetical protein JNN33_05665 [Rhodospirillaceae bacterium]|nr:hypothetical protein [Rhodospirillaceae bacterium]
MLNDAPMEVGKVRDGFLTDAHNRRIYFPPIGVPRRIPTPAAEAKFRENIMWSSAVGWFLSAAAMFAVIFVPNTSGRGSGIFFFLILACRYLGASLFAHRLPPLDDPTITYRRAIQETYVQRSFPWLCMAVLIGVAGLIGFSMAPGLLWFWKDWDAESDLDRYLGLYTTSAVSLVIAVMCIFWTRHLIAALRLKIQGNQPRSIG